MHHFSNLARNNALKIFFANLLLPTIFFRNIFTHNFHTLSSHTIFTPMRRRSSHQFLALLMKCNIRIHCGRKGHGLSSSPFIFVMKFSRILSSRKETLLTTQPHFPGRLNVLERGYVLYMIYRMQAWDEGCVVTAVSERTLWIGLDASKAFGFRAMIFHVTKRFDKWPSCSDPQPNMFLSRLLTSAEKNYWPSESETKRIVWTLRKVRYMVKSSQKYAEDTD